MALEDGMSDHEEATQQVLELACNRYRGYVVNSAGTSFMPSYETRNLTHLVEHRVA